MPASKTVCIVTLRENDETESVVGVTATFRLAYRIARFHAEIKVANHNERQAREALKKSKTKSVILWDADKHEYEEAAVFSPVGKLAKVQRVPYFSK